MSEGLMSPERFTALAEAYGAQIRLWPEDERTAAVVFAKTEHGRTILRDADKLDALLEQYRPPQPSVTLRASIAHMAVVHAVKRQRLRWGVGLAGAGFAGLLAGLVVTAILVPPSYAPFQDHGLTVGATAFGDVASDSDSLEEEE